MESTTTKAKALSRGGGTFSLRPGSAPVQERRVGAQAERVKAKVAGHGAVQVVGRLVPGEPHLALRLGWLRRGSRCHHMHRLRRRRHCSQLWVPLSRACSVSLLEARRAELHCMAQASAKRVCLFCKLCCPLHRPVLAATAPALPVSCRRNAQPMLPECVRHPRCCWPLNSAACPACSGSRLVPVSCRPWLPCLVHQVWLQNTALWFTSSHLRAPLLFAKEGLDGQTQPPQSQPPQTACTTPVSARVRSPPLHARPEPSRVLPSGRSARTWQRAVPSCRSNEFLSPREVAPLLRRDGRPLPFRQIGLDDKRVFERACRNCSQFSPQNLVPISRDSTAVVQEPRSHTRYTAAASGSEHLFEGCVLWHPTSAYGKCACCGQAVDFFPRHSAVTGADSGCFKTKRSQHARQRQFLAPSLVHDLLMP